MIKVKFLIAWLHIYSTVKRLQGVQGAGVIDGFFSFFGFFFNWYVHWSFIVLKQEPGLNTNTSTSMWSCWKTFLNLMKAVSHRFEKKKKRNIVRICSVTVTLRWRGDGLVLCKCGLICPNANFPSATCKDSIVTWQSCCMAAIGLEMRTLKKQVFAHSFHQVSVDIPERKWVFGSWRASLMSSV